ncbi:vacuolar protein sorting/targeting protein PEP1, partial [Nowakowskiella sp. JEL0078]
MLLLCLNGVLASGTASIEVSTTSFDHIPSQLFYLENSEIIFLLESQSNKVWRSVDEGKSWKKVSDIPDDVVMSITPHPHFGDVVFALTQTEKHYISTDKGNSWRTFELPNPPALVS